MFLEKIQFRELDPNSRLFLNYALTTIIQKPIMMSYVFTLLKLCIDAIEK